MVKDFILDIKLNKLNKLKEDLRFKIILTALKFKIINFKGA